MPAETGRLWYKPNETVGLNVNAGFPTQPTAKFQTALKDGSNP
ncbi:hypothetical protein [Neisseria iguanae]|nr:hypothetical protein [Neisseria iguanae]